MGREAGLYEPGSPFLINFRTDNKKGSPMIPLNTPVAPCYDSSLGCSCGDCPVASTCAEPAPPAPPKSKGCSVNIAGHQVKKALEINTLCFAFPGILHLKVEGSKMVFLCAEYSK